jgi:hypothetical protein
MCDRLKEMTQFLLDKLGHFYPVRDLQFLPREDYMIPFVNQSGTCFGCMFWQSILKRECIYANIYAYL